MSPDSRRLALKGRHNSKKGYSPFAKQLPSLQGKHCNLRSHIKSYLPQMPQGPIDVIARVHHKVGLKTPRFFKGINDEMPVKSIANVHVADLHQGQTFQLSGQMLNG